MIPTWMIEELKRRRREREEREQPTLGIERPPRERDVPARRGPGEPLVIEL
jgi:hypothetical protein